MNKTMAMFLHYHHPLLNNISRKGGGNLCNTLPVTGCSFEHHVLEECIHRVDDEVSRRCEVLYGLTGMKV